MTTLYNSVEQKIILDCKTCWTLSWLKEQKTTLDSDAVSQEGQQRAQTGQMKIEKNVTLLNELQFQLQHENNKVKIWRQKHKFTNLTCVLSKVQSGKNCLIVGEKFFWDTFSLNIFWVCLNGTAYLSNIADQRWKVTWK